MRYVEGGRIFCKLVFFWRRNEQRRSAYVLWPYTYMRELLIIVLWFHASHFKSLYTIRVNLHLILGLDLNIVILQSMSTSTSYLLPNLRIRSEHPIE